MEAVSKAYTQVVHHSHLQPATALAAEGTPIELNISRRRHCVLLRFTTCGRQCSGAHALQITYGNRTLVQTNSLFVVSVCEYSPSVLQVLVKLPGARAAASVKSLCPAKARPHHLHSSRPQSNPPPQPPSSSWGLDFSVCLLSVFVGSLPLFSVLQVLVKLPCARAAASVRSLSQLKARPPTFAGMGPENNPLRRGCSLRNPPATPLRRSKSEHSSSLLCFVCFFHVFVNISRFSFQVLVKLPGARAAASVRSLSQLKARPPTFAVMGPKNNPPSTATLKFLSEIAGSFRMESVPIRVVARTRGSATTVRATPVGRAKTGHKQAGPKQIARTGARESGLKGESSKRVAVSS